MGFIIKKPRIFPHLGPRLRKKRKRKLGPSGLPRPMKSLRRR